MNNNALCSACVAAAVMTFAVFHPGVARADLPSVTVHYGDLNLQTASGIQMLYRRINQAAEDVCRQEVPDIQQLQQRLVWLDCVDYAVEHAVAKVGNDRLAALYAQGHSRKVS